MIKVDQRCASSLNQPVEFVTVAEAARRYGCAPSYLYRLVRNGRLRAVKVGRCLQISADQIPSSTPTVRILSDAYLL